MTLAILKEIGQLLIDIHSQHETQSLLNVDKHIELLDSYYQVNDPQFLKEYEELYHKWSQLKKDYKEQNQNEKELAQRLDLLTFQLNEIQSANLIPKEDDELLEERNTLVHFERIFQSLKDAYNGLHGEMRGGLDWLSHTANHLEAAGENNQELQKLYEDYIDHYYMIEEISYKIRQHIDGMEFDPERLEFIESRLNELNQLKKKYGSNVEEIMEYSATIEEELETIKNRDEHLLRLEQRFKELTEDLLLEAKQLHDVRVKAAKGLEKAVLKELKELYLEKANFIVEVAYTKSDQNELMLEGSSVRPNNKGIDRIHFYISTNPGEPPKELNKIASGGEMSRIMLAMKNIFAQHQGITSVIFDEVDTGVSGRVAQAMAEKMYNISIDSQVLCITHLPQVAAIADTHLRIEKHMNHDRTTTSVTELSREDRIAEIGKMITGEELTEASKQHAKELIEMNKSR